MIDVARAAFSQVEYRKTEPRINAALRARDPLSTELLFKTLLIEEADAVAFAADIMAIRREGHTDWKMSVKTGEYNYQLGDTIEVFYPRYGLDNGGDFIIKAIGRDESSQLTKLTLYGPRGAEA